MAKKKQQVVARRLFEFAPLISGRRLLRVTVGPALDPVLLSADERSEYRRATRRSDRHTVALAETAENDYFVQPLPDGQWLLARSRAARTQEHNARIYQADGGPAGSFHAGDGIEDVQVTNEGRVWVGFFDEGVFSLFLETTVALHVIDLECL